MLSLSPAGALRWSFDLAPGVDGDVHPGAPVIGSNGDIYVPGGYTGKFFALTAVPEPPTIVAAASCLAVSAMRASNRRRRIQLIGFELAGIVPMPRVHGIETMPPNC